RRARARGQAGDRRVGDDAPVHAVHDVEHGADDRGVRAERVRPRHGKAGRAEGRDDPVLPVHRVRGGEELAGRLPPEHVLLAAGGEVVGRVRLAAPELFHGQRAAEARDVHAQVALERGRVEPVLLADLCGGRDHPDRPAARQYNPTLGGRHMTSTGPAGPWTHAFAHVDGVRLHYVRLGAGTPVLLLHGWPGFWYEWAPVIPPLAAHHDVIVPDPGRDAWVAAYSQPGALRGGFAYYEAFERVRTTQADAPAETLRVEVPTLVLWGDADAILPGAWADRLPEYFAKLTLKRVPC